MFKLDASVEDARKRAKDTPDDFQIGSQAWVTVRFTAEKPMPKRLWEKWLKESYALSGLNGPTDARAQQPGTHEHPAVPTTNLELRTEYWHDDRARAAFKTFMRTIHGLDFTRWESAGFWDDAHTPFSYFQGEEIVASVCIYLLDAIVEGRSTRLVQISGVGTLPAWRRRGLSRQLTEIGLAWAAGRHEGVFLFADDDAVAYYEHTGFRPVQEVRRHHAR